MYGKESYAIATDAYLVYVRVQERRLTQADAK